MQNAYKAKNSKLKQTILMIFQWIAHSGTDYEGSPPDNNIAMFDGKIAHRTYVYIGVDHCDEKERNVKGR